MPTNLKSRLKICPHEHYFKTWYSNNMTNDTSRQKDQTLEKSRAIFRIKSDDFWQGNDSVVTESWQNVMYSAVSLKITPESAVFPGVSGPSSSLIPEEFPMKRIWDTYG